jgi:hypothetical protein
METIVYCSRCARAKSISPKLWESRYRDLFTGYNGAFMLCDDIDCMGFYRLEQPEAVKTSA